MRNACVACLVKSKPMFSSKMNRNLTLLAQVADRVWLLSEGGQPPPSSIVDHADGDAAAMEECIEDSSDTEDESELGDDHEDQHGDEHEDEDEDEDDDGAGFFIVDRIIRHRFTQTHGIEYLTRWDGYGPADDTWEPTSSFHRCMLLVENYNLAHFGILRLSCTRAVSVD
jgi:hypothetical protein